jgi:dimethylamine monooxygenase subunit A
MNEILQSSLPVAPWMAEHTLRLPGTTPIGLDDWLQRDDAYAAQMAYRDQLIATRAAEVHALLAGAEAAAEELLGTVLAHLAGVSGYVRESAAMRRPDGALVPLDGPPLIAAGRLVQEDLCLLEKPDGAGEHVLTGAILCFPSNWTLSQKIGRSLSRIHLPVAPYDENIARRVQRMFDTIRPEAPVMRSNLLLYSRPDLHNPRHEFARHAPAPGAAEFVRVERQTILRLPVSRAVVFSIHTYMVAPAALSPEQRAGFDAARPGALASA